MSDLSSIEKRKLERLFCMGSGYVLNFTDRTFSIFFEDYNIDIDNNVYRENGTSKANRLRAFWELEANYTVGNIIEQMILYGESEKCLCTDHDVLDLITECRKIAHKLKQALPINELEALTALTDEIDFNVVAEQVKNAIERNQPEAGLDRLHTFFNKFIRVICQSYDIEITRGKPMHAVFGELIKKWRAGNLIESEMTERILKSSISILESFNNVRNDKSLAHDNPILNYEESLLIYNHISALVRFIKSIEHKLPLKENRLIKEELPF